MDSSTSGFWTYDIVVYVIWVYGILFSDINECLLNPCDANADCTNTIGSFTCKCNAGFEGDGLTCKGMLSVTFLSVKFC